MIGHALRRVAGRAGWDRPIAIGFAIGSACFLVGPFPGFVQLVGATADAAVFFAGSIFFTLAAALELREGTLRLGRWATDPSWWSAAIQFVGTLLFNVSTFDALQDGLSSKQQDRLIWAPDAFGSACFLASGLLGYRVAAGAGLRPSRRDREWRMAAINLTGCILFGISAVASFVLPAQRIHPRPRRRQLDHLAGRALLSHRRPDASAPPCSLSNGGLTCPPKTPGR